MDDPKTLIFLSVYLEKRLAYVDALLMIKTELAVEIAVNHLEDVIWVCQHDEMGLRDILPALYIRLGRKQECYDFMKWWVTTGKDPSYKWGSMKSFLNCRHESVFRRQGVFLRDCDRISHLATLTLLNVRVLKDLHLLQRWNEHEARCRVPFEVSEKIRRYIVSDAVGFWMDITEEEDHSKNIRMFERQIKKLYEAGDATNEYIWPAIVHRGEGKEMVPTPYTWASVEKMQNYLKYSYDAWVETPGAIEIIKMLEEN